jgi:uncharacterized protein YcnI
MQPASVIAGSVSRFALQVANLRDVSITQVRVQLPPALTILGVDAPAGWTARSLPATDTSPLAVEWTGALAPHELREFAVLARLTATAAQHELVFPVELRGADGGTTAWGGSGAAPAPMVQIAGGLGVTAGGAFALAAGAFGVALLAIALSVKRSG